MTMQAPVTGQSVTDALRAVDTLSTIVTEDADKADRAAAFPERSIAALRSAGLMAAAAPRTHGGLGFTTAELCRLAAALGRLCGSTAMIWAMHQIQLACLQSGAERQPEMARYLSRVASDQLLIASVTSEEGVGGNLRSSRAALTPEPGGGFAFTKHATTVSYGQHADAFLVTMRRRPEAAAGDQVLVLAQSQQTTLQTTGGWDTLGMRGTCSPPCVVAARVPAWQVLDEPFGAIASRCMVPLSQVLWSAVWSGISADALDRAVGLTRERLRNSTSAPNTRIGLMHARQQMISAAIGQFAADYDADPQQPGLGVAANALKLQVSLDTVRICESALEVCGMPGYSEVGRYSVTRHLRDLYSARLMISNDRLATVNAEMVTFGDGLP